MCKLSWAWSLPLAFGGALATSQPAHRLVHQFTDHTWVEKMAVRPNGNLLLTTLVPNASLYEVIDPAGKPSTTLRFTTASVDSFFGIAELAPDEFGILGGNHTLTAGLPGQWAVWTVQGAGKQPRLAASLPDAVFLNGASSVPGRPDLMLAADSTLGAVFRVNVRSGAIDKTQDVPEMKPQSGTQYAIGINGLRIHGAYLYFTNSATHTLFRLRVNSDGTTFPSAKVETIGVLDASFADDFTFGPGVLLTAYVASNYNGSVIAVSPGGYSPVAAGGTESSLIPSDTSCRFGRTARDANVLYVSTAGTPTSPGGKVEAFWI